MLVRVELHSENQIANFILNCSSENILKMPSYKTSFNSNWCGKYSWVKPCTDDKHKAYCTFCKCLFSVATMGESALSKHQNLFPYVIISIVCNSISRSFQ